jgi:hypothetical protein
MCATRPIFLRHDITSLIHDAHSVREIQVLACRPSHSFSSQWKSIGSGDFLCLWRYSIYNQCEADSNDLWHLSKRNYVFKSVGITSHRAKENTHNEVEDNLSDCVYSDGYDPKNSCYAVQRSTLNHDYHHHAS